MKRGVVIAPRFDLSSDGKILRWHGLDPSHLRWCALYWDAIDCPDNIVGGASLRDNRDDLKVLEQNGLFERTRGHFVLQQGEDYRLSFHGEHPHEFWTLAQLYAYQKHNTVDQGGWTISQPTNRVVLPDSEVTHFFFIEPDPEKSRGRAQIAPKAQLNSSQTETISGPILDAQLYNARPVPHSSVPMRRVLEFKAKYKEQLWDLRDLMDEFLCETKAALKTTGPELAARKLSRVNRKLDRALAEVTQQMDRTGLKRVFATEKANLSLKDIGGDIKDTAEKTALGFLGGSALGLPILGGLAGATYSIAPKLAARVVLAKEPRQILSENAPYAYLYHAQTELGSPER